MAAESRTNDPSVEPAAPLEASAGAGAMPDALDASTVASHDRALEAQLAGTPYNFGFFQAVRLLERLMGGVPAGRFARPQDEAVRFTVNNTLAFPASEIQALAIREGAPPRMTVNFMGLTGPEGVLPLYYTQLVAERARAHDTAVRDFFDIFNHRAISLFYQAWEKYRFTIQFERGGSDGFSHHLLDFVGLGTPGLAGRQAVGDRSLMNYAGLLSGRPRSAAALRQILEDYFEVPVEIGQFAGGWYKLSPGTQCRLEGGTSESERLAFGAVVGDEIWDEQARVRIRLGPLTIGQYQDFLPTGTAYAPLCAITRFFSGAEIDFEAQLILKREEVPPCELGREDATAPRLGWLTWAKCAGLDADPGDTVLEL
jgi:type VI secretion system protein ImpH